MTRQVRRGLLVTALLLGVAGGGLLMAAANTPVFTDPETFFAGRTAIWASLDTPGGVDSRQASAAFEALQASHRTPKWRLADLGYSAAAWAVLIAGLALVRPSAASTRKAATVVPVLLIGTALGLVGAIGGAVQVEARDQVPPWFDPGLAVAGVGLLAACAIPLLAALILVPLLYRDRGAASLLTLRGRGWTESAIATALYAPAACVAASGLLTVGEPGGWGLSTGGAILVWACLNSRAICIGPNFRSA